MERSIALQMKTKGATRPCEGFKPPPKVAAGETFSADGKTRKIGVILAHQAENDVQPQHNEGRMDLCCGRNFRGHPYGSKS